MPCRPALILAGLIWTASAASGGPVLYLRPTAVLPAGGLSLGAIADVRSEDPREAAGLAALGLGAVPARAAFLPPQEVRRRVERSWAGRVDVVGAGVALLPEAAVPAALREQAGAVLHALGRAGLGWVEVDFLSPLPTAAGEASVISTLKGGRMQVLFGDASVLVFVHPFAAVARAARDLPRDRLLGGEDVEFTAEDLAGLRGGYLTAADLQGSFRLLSPVARGALLERSRLARSLLVRAGERVTVVFVRPGLSITLSGKAWGSAGPGETVEVSLRDPARRFRGTVSGSGEVVVEQL